MIHRSLETPKFECLPKTLERVFGYKPRDEQLEAIKTLAIDQKDLILIARTNFGKSMVFQSVPILRNGISLIIMPLNLLEKDQVSST
jgi:superfamily II DNA helicase RecQ